MIDLCQRVRLLLSELNTFVQMKFFFLLLGSSYCWNQYLISADQCYVGFYFEKGLSVFQGCIVHQLKITNRYCECPEHVSLENKSFSLLNYLDMQVIISPCCQSEWWAVKKNKKKTEMGVLISLINLSFTICDLPVIFCLIVAVSSPTPSFVCNCDPRDKIKLCHT